MDQYVKKHTFIFITMLLVIIMILTYSFVLLDNSDFSDTSLINDTMLKMTFKNKYINIAKSNDLSEFMDNEIIIHNYSNTKEHYKLYVESENEIINLYYKIDDGEIKKISDDGLILENDLDARTSITLKIGFSTNEENIPNIKFTLK